MLDTLSLVRQQGTLDELGIGTVRDAPADLLFPGTSTIQTRPRAWSGRMFGAARGFVSTLCICLHLREEREVQLHVLNFARNRLNAQPIVLEQTA